MMKIISSTLLFGLLCFGVVTTEREHENDTIMKVMVRAIAFQTVDVGTQSPHTDLHLSEPYNGRDKGNNKSLNTRNRDENMRHDSSVPVNSPHTDANGPKSGHKLWQLLQGKHETGAVQRPSIKKSTTSPIVTDVTTPKLINQSNFDPALVGTFIVGGVQSLPRNWPWQASVQYLASDGAWHHFCGASLVHTIWLVTAAHCLVELEHHMVRIVLGEYKLTQTSLQEQVINPSRMLLHAYFDPHTLYYDIAMIKLAHSPTLNQDVNTITMASAGNNLSSATTCYITGWGKTVGTSSYMSDTLQESPMTVVSKNDCRKSYHDIVDTQICVASATSSACTGDSGSPLLCMFNNNWKLTGLASWIGNEFCLPTSPNVFTRISSYKDWVGNVTLNY